MDESGFCQFAAIGNLAHRAVVSLENAEKAVAILEGPDTNSSDPDNEGRRIERVPGGWIVLNAPKYREIVTRAVAQEKTRLRVSNFRARKKSSVTLVTKSNASVTPSEAEAYTHTEAIKKLSTARFAAQDTKIFLKAYQAYPRHVGARAAEKAWKAAISRKTLFSSGEMDPEDIPEVLYQRVMTYAACMQRIGKEKQFIPHMSTWLNQDRFMDDPTEWAVQEQTNDRRTSKAERRVADMAATTARVFGEAGQPSGNAPARLPAKST